MRNIAILCLFALTATLSDGAIETAIVEKSQRFFQIDQNNVETDSAIGAYPDGGEIYNFWAAVEGEGISGLATPMLSMPAGYTYPDPDSQSQGGFDLTWDGYAWELQLQSMSTADKQELDTTFPNGTYTIEVDGQTVSLDVTGDAYPDPMLLESSGGVWVNETLYFDPTQSLTLTVTPFDGYGTHLLDRVAIEVDDQTMLERMSMEDSSTTPLEYTIPANSYASGESSWILVQGNIATGMDDVLGDAIQVGIYTTGTWVKLSAISPATFDTTSLTGDWYVTGYDLDTDSSNAVTDTNAFSGTATIAELADGLAYRLTFTGEGETEAIDLVVNGNYLEYTDASPHPTAPNVTERSVFRLHKSDADTLVFSEIQAAQDQENTPYYMDSSHGALIRQEPTASVANWEGDYTLIDAVEWTVMNGTYGILSESDGIGENITLNYDGNGRFQAITAEDTEGMDVLGNRLTFDFTSYTPDILYSDDTWYVQKVYERDVSYVIQLGNGNALIVGSHAIVGELYPHDPDAYPGWQATRFISSADTFAEIMEKTTPDNPDYAAWLVAQGIDGEDALPDATPNEDKLPNMLRYALNLSENSLYSESLLPMEVENIEGEEYLQMVYPVRKDLAEVSIQVQSSLDLKLWSDVPVSDIVQLEDIDEDTAAYLVSIPIGTDRNFLRITARSL